ncbi:MAG: metal-dependent hydrolase [Anaerolineae bacterium]|nr:metal-dependent hydrolase [Anaerolineae bacterium]
MLFGHLAVSALEHRYLKAEFAPVMVAAVFPDAVDKVLHYVAGQTEAGRSWGHTLFAVLVTTVLVRGIWGQQNARSWALGYLSHLLCDIGGVVPWLYPLAAYEFPVSEGFAMTLWQSLTNIPKMILELALSIWALVGLWPRVVDLKDRGYHLAWLPHGESAHDAGEGPRQR